MYIQTISFETSNKCPVVFKEMYISIESSCVIIFEMEDKGLL